MIRCLALGNIVYEMRLKLLIVREKAVVRTKYIWANIWSETYRAKSLPQGFIKTELYVIACHNIVVLNNKTWQNTFEIT